jgi:hypothetical protein
LQQLGRRGVDIVLAWGDVPAADPQHLHDAHPGAPRLQQPVYDTVGRPRRRIITAPSGLPTGAEQVIRSAGVIEVDGSALF